MNTPRPHPLPDPSTESAVFRADSVLVEAVQLHDSADSRAAVAALLRRHGRRVEVPTSPGYWRALEIVPGDGGGRPDFVGITDWVTCDGEGGVCVVPDAVFGGRHRRFRPAAQPLIALVACGGRKAETARPAVQLYKGVYFLECLAAARTLVEGDDRRVFIVSALHGLVPAARRLEPYEMRLGRPGAITGGRLREQAREAGLLGRPVVVLGGREYVALVRQVWPQAVAPLAGVGGIGYQRRELARITAGTVDPLLKQQSA